MEDWLRNSTSITLQRLLSPSNLQTCHSISRILEHQPTCKFITLTENGIRSSRSMANMSSMSEVQSYLFLEKILKQLILALPRRTDPQLNTGRLFTATALRIILPVSMSNSDSRSTSHSSSSVSCTWDMLFVTMVTLTLGTTRILINNGSLIKFQRLSDQLLPHQTHLVLTQATINPGITPQLTQDGTNSWNSKMDIFNPIRVMFWPSQMENSSPHINMPIKWQFQLSSLLRKLAPAAKLNHRAAMVRTKDGRSSILKIMRRNGWIRETTPRTTVSLSKDHSTLCQEFHPEDTSKFIQTNKLLLELQLAHCHKHSITAGHRELSWASNGLTTNLLLSNLVPRIKSSSEQTSLLHTENSSTTENTLFPQEVDWLLRLWDLMISSTMRPTPRRWAADRLLKDGRLSMLMKHQSCQPSSSTRSMDSISIDHSSSFHGCTTERHLRCTKPSPCWLIVRTSPTLPSNSTSTRQPRLSSPFSTEIILFPSTPVTTTPSLCQPTLSGTRESESMVNISPTRRAWT